ncbi:MAG TPA: hypothetical protein VMV10_19350 [Pirellulales bacterium]|nr:hypothetical protein [Pirellulales bacterium]
MEELNRVIISSESPDKFFDVAAEVVREFPPDVRQRFLRMWGFYTHFLGLDGAFERLNNRTVSTMLAEFEKLEKPKPLVSGERDGLRFALYEAPNPAAEKESDSGGKSS